MTPFCKPFALKFAIVLVAVFLARPGKVSAQETRLSKVKTDFCSFQNITIDSTIAEIYTYLDSCEKAYDFGGLDISKKLVEASVSTDGSLTFAASYYGGLWCSKLIKKKDFVYVVREFANFTYLVRCEKGLIDKAVFLEEGGKAIGCTECLEPPCISGSFHSPKISFVFDPKTGRASGFTLKHSPNKLPAKFKQ